MPPVYLKSTVKIDSFFLDEMKAVGEWILLMFNHQVLACAPQQQRDDAVRGINDDRNRPAISYLIACKTFARQSRKDEFGRSVPTR